MKPGTIIEEFQAKAKDGTRLAVVFRLPKMADAKELLYFINKLRDEARFLGQFKHETLKSEKAFLKSRLQQLQKRKGVLLIALANGKIIGSANISPMRLESNAHVGEFGIGLLEEFTGIGIGTRFAKAIIKLAKSLTDYKMLESSYYSLNKRSAALHKKLGFKKIGVLPKGAKLKWKNYYDDHVLLYKFLKRF